MTTSEAFLYLLVGIVVFFTIRRYLIHRSLRHYSPAEVMNLIQNNRNVVLLDVRTEGERRASSIKGSLHMPLHQIMKRSDELGKYRDKEIVCYCQTGNRSLTAAWRLRKLGFNAANLKGGIAEWNFQNRIS